MFGREPNLWAEFIRAILACSMAFGLEITVEQFALVMTAVSAALTLITREAVTSNVHVAKKVESGVSNQVATIMDKAAEKAENRL